MKLLVIILGYRHQTCYNYINTVKNTWGKLKNENIHIVDSFGNSPKNEIINDTIYVSKNDFGEENTYEKLLEVFNVAYNNIDFDVILKTSNSAYFRLDLIYNILKKYNLKNFFGSTFCHPSDSGCFTGMSMILSKDVIKKLLDNRYIKNPNSGWDDTGIEYLLRQIYPNYAQQYKNFKRLDIMENSLLRLQDPLFKIKYGDIWAFRCKTSNSGIIDRDLDLKKIELLHNIFYNNR